MSVRRLGGEWIAYEVHDASYHCRFCDELVKCGEQHSHTFHKEEGARSWDGQFAEPLAGSGGGRAQARAVRADHLTSTTTPYVGCEPWLTTLVLRPS